MFDETVSVDLPPKLSALINDGWTFPTDYPVVNDATSPDASKTLKVVIAYSITEYYADHRICSYNIDYFTQRLTSRLYNKMAQHQYWIDQYIGLINDGQFFFNEEWQDGGSHVTGTDSRTTDSLSKSSDTPQNSVTDINNYLTNANKEDGTEASTTASDNISDLHIKKSTLGDITVQFRNFAEFPSFIDQLIKAVSPCFIEFYGNEEVDYGPTV